MKEDTENKIEIILKKHALEFDVFKKILLRVRVSSKCVCEINFHSDSDMTSNEIDSLIKMLELIKKSTV